LTFVYVLSQPGCDLEQVARAPILLSWLNSCLLPLTAGKRHGRKLNLREAARLVHELRAVGQAIELLTRGDFEVIVDGDDYLIRAQTTQASSQRRFWQLNGPSNQQFNTVEIRCTPDIVRRIDKAGKARRSNPDALPDPLSPSEILRVIGNSLAARQQSIKRIERRGDFLMIEYESATGTPGREERLVSSL
jgi:hypothetical protein